MEDICRLCFQKEESMLYIFSFKGEELCSLIFNCCSVKITKDDALPKLICMECIGKLKAFDEFRERCKIFDSVLREYYKKKFNSEDSLSKIKIYQNVHVQTDITNEILQMENSPLSVEVKKISEKNDFRTYSNNNDDHIQTDDEFDNSKHFNNVVSNTSYSQDSLQSNSKLKLKRKSTRLEINDRRRSDRLKNKEKISKCNFCGKECLSKRAFIEHTKLHIDEKNSSKRKDFKLFKCIICGMRFNRKFKLHSHLRIHGKVFPKESNNEYLCNICNKIYESKNKFQKHFKIHNGLKQYTCQFCDKTFVLKSYKKRHEKKHAEEKYFECYICNVSITSYNEFIHHSKEVHSGEVNYYCKICNKAFSKKKYLDQHSFMHTEDRSFVCKICGSTYKYFTSLCTHIKKCKLQQNLDYIVSKEKENH